MLSRLNMNRKLLFTLLPLTVVIMTLLLLFIRHTVQLTVSERAREATMGLVQADGEKLLEPLIRSLHETVSFANVLQNKERINQFERRDFANELLRNYLASRPDLLGVWTGWEPDAFDGLDSMYADSPGHDASGRFIPYWYRDAGKLELTYLLDYEDTDKGAYYQLAKQQRKPVVLDPFLYPVGDKTILMTTIAVPIIIDGQFLGVIGVDISVDTLQSEVAKFNTATSVSALFGHHGTVIAHPDGQRLGRNMEETEGDFMGQYLAPASTAVKNATSYSAEFYSSIMQDDVMVTYMPLSLGETGASWSLARIVPIGQVLADVNSIIRQVVLLGVGALVFFTLAIVLLARTISRPLDDAAAALEDVASGEGDLTRRLQVRGKDEVTRLSIAFNTFAERVQQLVTRLAQHSQTLAATAAQLGSSSQQAAHGAEQQRGEIEQVAAAMDELTATVQEVASNAQLTSAATQTGREQTEQGTALLREVSQTIGGQAAEIQRTAARLAELEGASNEIELVITTIQGVAEQTNLLALNAAIEAARAGEHGRGFAVVADEVRALASRTHTSTEEISSTIARLQGMTREAVAAMGVSQQMSEASVEKAEQGLLTLEEIADQVRQIEEMNLLVASTTEQQSATTQELATNASRIGQLAEQAASGASQTADGSRAIEQLAKELNQLIGQFRY